VQYSASEALSNEADIELGEDSQDRQLDPAGGMPTEHPAAGAPRFRIVPPDIRGDVIESPGALPHDVVPDDALIAALVVGEVEALGALYDRHARIVFAVLIRIVGDRDSAEDLLQEVFLRVWQHAHDFDDTRGTVRVWLHSIAHNLALNELRRRRRRPHVHQRPTGAEPDSGNEAEHVDTGSDPAVDAWYAVRDAELAQALDQLPAGQRAVLLLYAEGFSQSQIAEQLDEPLGTIKSRMRRALGQLRETLSALGIDAGWRND
jgi:RNA polymerase sigma-70 factor, ECF subfamily